MNHALKQVPAVVSSMRDLSQFGIEALTGEACAYSMRILCDVNEAGKQLLEEYLGVELVLARNWNSTVASAPAIGSIMLSRQHLQPLAQFAFFRAGAVAVVVGVDGSIVGIYDHARLQQYEALGIPASERYDIHRNPTASRSDQPVVGSRNVHAFTARSI